MSVLDDIKVLTGNKKTSHKTSTTSSTVLIVEDEKALLDILAERLTSEGYHVLKATNGKEGLDMAKAHHPHIMVLDLMMPIMDGKTMLHELRKLPEFKTLPVIILTSAGEVENIRDTQRYDDAVEFLIKSNVTMDEVVQKIKRVAW